MTHTRFSSIDLGDDQEANRRIYFDKGREMPLIMREQPSVSGEGECFGCLHLKHVFYVRTLDIRVINLCFDCHHRLLAEMTRRRL